MAVLGTVMVLLEWSIDHGADTLSCAFPIIVFSADVFLSVLLTVQSSRSSIYLTFDDQGLQSRDNTLPRADTLPLFFCWPIQEATVMLPPRIPALVQLASDEYPAVEPTSPSGIIHETLTSPLPPCQLH